MPFPIESCLSGQAPTTSAAFVNTSWYRLVLSAADQFPASSDGSRLLLHFGAVNWQSVVYVGGKLAGNHTGGYDGFTVEVTEAAARAAAGDDAAPPSGGRLQPGGQGRAAQRQGTHLRHRPAGRRYLRSACRASGRASGWKRCRRAMSRECALRKMRPVLAGVCRRAACQMSTPHAYSWPPLEYSVVDHSVMTVAKYARSAPRRRDIEPEVGELGRPTRRTWMFSASRRRVAAGASSQNRGPSRSAR